MVAATAVQVCLRTISHDGLNAGPRGPGMVAQPLESRPCWYRLSRSCLRLKSDVTMVPCTSVAAASSARPLARNTLDNCRYVSGFVGSSSSAAAAASRAFDGSFNLRRV